MTVKPGRQGQNEGNTYLFSIVDGVDFPGDILLGMNFLRQHEFSLCHEGRGPPTLVLNNEPLSVTYVGGERKVKLYSPEETVVAVRSGVMLTVTRPAGIPNEELLIRGIGHP